MKPRKTIASVTAPDGDLLVLEEHDGDYYVRLGGVILMSTRSTVSERFLAEIVARRLAGKPSARVLIGGLGFGFTAAELLARTDERVSIEIAELFEDVIEWNRQYLEAQNSSVLDHKRVAVSCADVWDVIGRPGEGAAFDAIVLDVDNGASALVQKRNGRLYTLRGLHRIHSSLNDRGYLAVWSAKPDASFSRRLQHAGFTVEEIPVRAHERARRSAHVVYLGRKTKGAAHPKTERDDEKKPQRRWSKRRYPSDR